MACCDRMMKSRAVQCIAVQDRTGHYSAVHDSTVHNITIQYGTRDPGTHCTLRVQQACAFRALPMLVPTLTHTASTCDGLHCTCSFTARLVHGAEGSMTPSRAASLIGVVVLCVFSFVLARIVFVFRVLHERQVLGEDRRVCIWRVPSRAGIGEEPLRPPRGNGSRGPRPLFLGEFEFAFIFFSNTKRIILSQEVE